MLGTADFVSLTTVYTLVSPTAMAKRDEDGLFRHYVRTNFTYTVVINSGVASSVSYITQEQIAAADAGTGYDGKAVFLGGHRNTVSEAEKTILEAAGYTVTTSVQ